MKVIQLSEKQRSKLSEAMRALQDMQREMARREAELSNLVELVFDAHGAPENAQIDPRTWTLLIPEEGDLKSEENAPVEPGDEATTQEASEGESGETA